MLTYEQLKESSIIMHVAKEVAEEMVEKKIARRLAKGRAATLTNVLTIAAQKRFPRLDLSNQIKLIHDPDALQSLLLELYNIKMAKAFIQRLVELTPTQTKTHNRAKKNGTSKK